MYQLDKKEQPPSLLDWQQVAEMVDSGVIEVGSHTRRHVRLNSDASEETLSDEIIGSKQTIEKHTGKKVKTFAEYLGKENNTLEAHRKELWGK